MSMLVHSAGYLTSVQDQGRIGLRHSGVSIGGALDWHGLRVANALVGNDDQAAGLEISLGRSRFEFADERLVAWCGGRFSVRLGEEELAPGHVALARPDAALNVGAGQDGGRAWLAISGGIDVPVVLGSRSTDLRGNFGGYEGRALRDGDVLALAKERGMANRRLKSDAVLESVPPWGAPATWAKIPRGNAVLRLVRGTDWQRFNSRAQRALVSEPFTVTSDSNRMGARLEGPQLEGMEPADLLSEAVTPGTLQVPPNGQPILLLGDCQTIGGYPKIAHVITVDLPLAAQLWPGDGVRFDEVSLEEAQLLLLQREEDFARFRVGLELQGA